MSHKANCWNNAPQESFFGHMKDEIDISWCTTFNEIHQGITNWANYYKMQGVSYSEKKEKRQEASRAILDAFWS